MQAKALQLHKKLCEQRGDAGLEEFTASDGKDVEVFSPTWHPTTPAAR